MANLNIKRIERDIEKYIPSILQMECEDPLIKSITITDCDLTHDLSYCKVYFTSLLDIDHKEIEKKINESVGFIRSKLSQMINVRNTPVLDFKYDTSIEYAEKIENIIDSFHE